MNVCYFKIVSRNVCQGLTKPSHRSLPSCWPSLAPPLGSRVKIIRGQCQVLNRTLECMRVKYTRLLTLYKDTARVYQMVYIWRTIANIFTTARLSFLWYSGVFIASTLYVKLRWQSLIIHYFHHVIVTSLHYFVWFFWCLSNTWISSMQLNYLFSYRLLLKSSPTCYGFGISSCLAEQ